MILPAQHIRKLSLDGWPVPPVGTAEAWEIGTIRRMVWPFEERGIFQGMSYGLGPATYDCRIRQTLLIPPGGCALASTIEKVEMPYNVRATVCDKSTWARKFLCVQNTKIDPGFMGHITLELTNHSGESIYVVEGMPIMQLEFCYLIENTELPYKGKYNKAGDFAQAALDGKDIWD